MVLRASSAPSGRVAVLLVLAVAVSGVQACYSNPSGCPSTPDEMVGCRSYFCTGTTCSFYDDDSMCSACDGETCDAGTCTITTMPITCDQCETCANGLCQAVTDGLPCDDQDDCTSNDECSGGSCYGIGSVSCNDTDACTHDMCMSPGGCYNPPIDCDDGQDCTVDTCDPMIGCIHTQLNCTTGDPCNEGYCMSGACVTYETSADCDDNDPCTENDKCDSGTCFGEQMDCGQCAQCDNGLCSDFISGPCDDGDDCYTGDYCSAGSCQPGTEFTCDDSETCTSDSCTGGVCQHILLDAVACDDGSACTSGDMCDLGTCVGTDLCDDSNLCTTDSCVNDACVNTPLGGCDECYACNPAIGACDPVSGPSCSPSNICYLDGYCVTGSCIGSTANPDACGQCQECSDGACLDLVDGTPCDDQDKCTTDEACVSGQCVGGEEVPDCPGDDPAAADEPVDPVIVGAAVGGGVLLVVAGGVLAAKSAGAGGGAVLAGTSAASAKTAVVAGVAGAGAGAMLATAALTREGEKANPFVRFLARNKFVFVDVLSKVTDTLNTDNLATTLVALFSAHDRVADEALTWDLIRWALRKELQGDRREFFRATTLPTRINLAYLHLYGDEFRTALLKPVIAKALKCKDSLEINPAVVKDKDQLQRNVDALKAMTDTFVAAIVGSAVTAPPEVRDMCKLIDMHAKNKFETGHVNKSLAGGSSSGGGSGSSSGGSSGSSNNLSSYGDGSGGRRRTNSKQRNAGGRSRSKSHTSSRSHTSSKSGSKNGSKKNQGKRERGNSSVSSQTSTSAKHTPVTPGQTLAPLILTRWLLPGITAPHKNGVVSRTPSSLQARNLLLVGKLLQNMASGGSRFVKEPYMQVMAQYVQENELQIDSWFQQLSEGGAAAATPLEKTPASKRAMDLGYLRNIVETHQVQLKDHLDKRSAKNDNLSGFEVLMELERMFDDAGVESKDKRSIVSVSLDRL